MASADSTTRTFYIITTEEGTPTALEKITSDSVDMKTAWFARVKDYIDNCVLEIEHPVSMETYVGACAGSDQITIDERPGRPLSFFYHKDFFGITAFADAERISL
jgi:hypothetical protein